jgi:LysR family glycine cleavage system transcriptional activator
VNDRLPPLNTLRVFDAVCRHMSFTRAAAELGMTQAAVSYQVKLLEDRIGAPVFRRLTRKLALTDAGQHLAPVVADTFARLAGAFATLAGRPDGVLSITAVTTFTTNWLVPRIGQFQLAWPDIAVRLDTDPRVVDLEREEFDVGIRGGNIARGQWPGLISHHLMTIDLAPFCTPRLLAEVGPVSSPEDLLKLPLLGEASLSRPGYSQADWIAWFRAAGVELTESPQVRSQFTLQHMLATAAIAGQGIALLTPAFFQREIAAGQLVRVLPYTLREVETYYLVYLASRRDVPKIKAFRDWLNAEIAADAALPAA